MPYQKRGAVAVLPAASRSCVWCLLCVLLFVLLCLPAPARAQDQVDVAGEQQLLSLVNQERARQGVPPVELDQHLTQAARKHTQRMVENNSLLHQLEGEEPLALRLSGEHVRCDRDGENIALDSDLAVAHSMLMRSPPHRANILNPLFNSVGIGVVRSGDVIYVTEDFAHVLPSYSDFEADAAAQQAITDFVRAQGLPLPPRKARPQLAQIACDMARDDKLDTASVGRIPGLSSAVAWNAADVGKLPASLKKLLSQPLDSGYALGVCFAPSASHPSGVYWLILVIY